MELFNILTFPDKFLSQPTRPVLNIDGRLQEIIDRMIETMVAAPGVGLASIQVGIGESLIVVESQPGEKKHDPLVLINPTIVAADGSVLSEEEGCLSVPDYRADVQRFAAVAVEAHDRHGKPIRLERDDFLAVVLQHEIDHLNGTLFIDRISALKRNLYKRRVMKQLKENE